MDKYKKLYSYKKLRAKIVEEYGSMRAFHEEKGDILRITYIAMSQKMRCKTQFSQEDIEIWRDLLNISVDDIGLYFFS